ncbi:peptide deformylase [Kocuria coralli]|uniref:Peptide deformylase n=1 Tax=Kocuria coralli TaxID=1461025 RepID=A0A5J5KX45_9MICC|nr:peptide deformylase [Kocuria coralli]KAA9393396.1 peptide deformylase [Kocuria coralli]
MAVRPIRTIGDPVLRSQASPVRDFDDAGTHDLQDLVDDMIETMHDVEGVGLAAPQIGVGLRIFVYDVEGQIGHVVNPELTVGEEPQDGSEGCLSVPGMGHPTPRARAATVHGFTVAGEPLTVSGEGLLARCLQHEYDHLNGTLYVDRLRGAAKKEAMKAIRQREYADVVADVQGQRAASLGSGRGSSFGGSSTTGFPGGGR